MRLIKRALYAFRYLTIMPPYGGVRMGAGDEAGALPFFPLAGMLVGAAVAALGFAVQYFYPTPMLWAVVCMIAVFVLTGGAHQSALAAACDGLAWRAQNAGGRERATRGSALGVSAVMLDFLLQCAVLATVYGRGVRLSFTAIVAAQVCSRLAMAVCASFGECAREGDADRALINGAGWRHALWAAAVASLCLVPFMGLSFWIPVVAASAVAVIAALAFKLAQGGVTGAALGAVNQLAQAFVLLMFLWERSS